MKTYPIYSDLDNTLIAFEIDNTSVFLSDIMRALQNSSNVKNVHIRKAFSKSPDVHITFDFFNQPYIVWEPWGDNSRYWIGPDNDNNPPIDIQELENLLINANKITLNRFCYAVVLLIILVGVYYIYLK